jgi:hypothetical protein
MNDNGSSFVGIGLGVMLRRLPILLIAFASSWWATSACAQTASCPACPAERPLMPRGQMEPIFDRLAVQVGPLHTLGHGDPSHKYRALTERECQCQAASASTLGNLFAEELHALSRKHGKLLAGDRQNQIQTTILTYSEAEARNMAAGSALDLYYKLAEAEARAELLAQTISSMDASLARMRDLMKQGIKVEGDYDDLRRQRLEFQADAVALEQGIDRLNGELKALLGGCNSDDARIWPAIEANDSIIPAVDPNRAIEEGSSRPQLVLARLLPDILTAGNLSAARMLLRSYNVLLGAEPKRSRLCALVELLCAALGSSSSLDSARNELELFAADRQQTVTKEIRLAAQAVNAARERLALTREEARIRQVHLTDVTAREAKGLVSFKETTAARMEWLRARSEVAKAAAELLGARAKLREAQGILAAECGFGPQP